LETARLYFNLKKAYVASLQRCEEIIAGNPTFSKIDEVLYIAGKSNLFLSEGKGKQSPTLYKRGGANLQSSTLTSDEFRDEARSYLSLVRSLSMRSRLRSVSANRCWAAQLPIFPSPPASLLMCASWPLSAVTLALTNSRFSPNTMSIRPTWKSFRMGKRSAGSAVT